MSAWVPGRNEARERLGDEFDKLSIESKLSVSRSVIDSSANPLVVPIYHSSTYVIGSLDEYLAPNHGGNFLYRRCGNPTSETAEVMIRELEGGAATLTYNSGLAATNAVFLAFLSAGDHLVCQLPIYSGTHMFIKNTLMRFGVEVTWVDTSRDGFVDKVAHSIKKNTKMIYVETPSNPVMTVIDVESVAKLGGKTANGTILTVVDSTFASPILQKPLDLGADIVLHSCTKYMGGHSDMIGGCVTTKTIELWNALKMQQLTTGSSMSPFDASLLIRGLKTASLRVIRCSESALKVATFLESHPKVKHVWYPGLESHPNHKIAKKQMRHFGGMIAFDVGDSATARHVVEAVKLIVFAVSLGGTESLIEHPASMSHGRHLHHHQDGEKENAGEDFSSISEGLIRLSIGLEDADDLVADLRRALDSVHN
uniref:plant cystathionine gamma-synthase n=1 Tax=Plectus sambesii TaxID=2011161 RepID=A0A914WLY9_9BILA